MHPNGVSYTKRTEGLSYEDDSKYWYKYDNEVHPNTSFTYLWAVPERVGPLPGESSCRTWAYYSGVNPVSVIEYPWSVGGAVLKIDCIKLLMKRKALNVFLHYMANATF
jgi:hypothetical protein